jgi:hypothetical protein
MLANLWMLADRTVMDQSAWLMDNLQSIAHDEGSAPEIEPTSRRTPEFDV